MSCLYLDIKSSPSHNKDSLYSLSIRFLKRLLSLSLPWKQRNNGSPKIRISIVSLGKWDLRCLTLPHSPTSQSNPSTDNKVVFCTGGAGSICSAQVRALVHLGANACIIGRNVAKTESMAKSIATARSGAKVIGIGAIDVRRVEDLERAVETCVKELGGIDFVM